MDRFSRHSYGTIAVYILGASWGMSITVLCNPTLAIDYNLLHSSRNKHSSQTATYPTFSLSTRAEQIVTQTIDVEPPSPNLDEAQDVDDQQNLNRQREQQAIEQQVQQELIDFTSPSSSSDVIILGQPENFPYVVVIPGNNREVLAEVQDIIPTAFFSSSRRGRYIYTASFLERRSADALNAQLRYLGFDAQVTYMPTD